MLHKTTLLFCALAATLWPQSSPPGITGEWSGTIAGKLRIIVRVDRAADDSLHASLESVDQGHVKLDIDTFTFEGKASVRFDLKKIGASYQGELNAYGSEITGSWQQGGGTVPLTLRRGGLAPPKTLRPTVRGRVSLDACPGNGQELCGIYSVFENRTKQNGRKIGLHVMILPAGAEKPAADPVFGFAGGPGQAATEAFPWVTSIVALRRQHDIVLIDQRGTGKSNPLRCDFDENDIQSLLNGPGSVKNLPACRQELETRADLTQYTTSNFADDVDEVREALGYDRIDVMGGSYGTVSGLVYLRRHGEHVRSMVLQGAATPDYRLPLPFAKTIQASLEHLFADCAADAVCRKDFPDLKADFETVVKRLGAKPATYEYSSQDVTLTRGAFVSDLRPMLYQPLIVSRLPYILHRAFENDFAPFTAGAVLMRRATNQSVARGLAFSVGCSESVPLTSESDIERETAGTYLGDYDVRTYQKNCQAWPHADVSKDFLKPVRSDVPVLLIAGAGDPATPPSWAEHAAETLPNGRVVTIPNGTHLTGAQCIDTLILSFVSRASAKGIDASCVKEVHNPPFMTLQQAGH